MLRFIGVSERTSAVSLLLRWQRDVTAIEHLWHINVCVGHVCVIMHCVCLQFYMRVCVCVCKLYACHGFLSEHKLGPGLQLTFYGIWAKSGHTYRHTNTWMTYNLHKSLSLALSLSYTHTHSHHSSSKSSITLQQQVKFNFQVRPVGCQPSGLLQLLYTQCFFSL